MSKTFNWCKDKTRLAIWNKPVFSFNGRRDKFWFLNGEIHRENGPACEYVYGDKEWFISGKLHREDGPAVQYISGYKSWYMDGKRHRENGPAIEYTIEHVNVGIGWFLNGKHYSESDYWKELNK